MCGFLLELQTSQDRLALCSAKWSYGQKGRCWFGLENLSKYKTFQKTTESICLKPSGGPL